MNWRHAVQFPELAWAGSETEQKADAALRELSVHLASSWPVAASNNVYVIRGSVGSRAAAALIIVASTRQRPNSGLSWLVHPEIDVGPCAVFVFDHPRRAARADDSAEQALVRAGVLATLEGWR
jgi:hypothetical protein